MAVSTGQLKPLLVLHTRPIDPVIFREALRHIAVSPDRAIFVGDFYSIDVAGARGVGITPILLDVKDLSSDRDVTQVDSLMDLAAKLGA